MTMDLSPPIANGQVRVLDGSEGLDLGIVLWPETDHLMIDTVAVAPKRQGKGLGRAVMDWAEAQAAARGLDKIRLYTNAVMVENIAFYQRLGYQVIGRGQDRGFDRVWFQKPLTRT